MLVCRVLLKVMWSFYYGSVSLTTNLYPLCWHAVFTLQQEGNSCFVSWSLDTVILFCSILPLLYFILVLPCRVHKSDLWVKRTWNRTTSQIIIDWGLIVLKIDSAKSSRELLFVLLPSHHVVTQFNVSTLLPHAWDTQPTWGTACFSFRLAC